MPASIILKGLGSYVPAKRLTNDDLSQMVATSDEWIRTRSGIRERRIAGPDENPSDMGAKAANAALAKAGLTSADVDLLIVGTMTPDLPFPSTACLMQNKLGLRTIPAFDVAAACSGFLYILEIGAAMLRAGPYRTALIVGTDKMSASLDWQDRSTCVLFGDGAGAAVLTRSEETDAGVIGSILHTEGAGAGLLLQPGGGAACPPTPDSLAERKHFLKMNGKEVFKVAVREMEQVLRDLLAQHGLTSAQIACVIPHQANIRILEALATRLEIPMERVFVNIDRYGNTSAASIPIALDEALAAGHIRPGDYVVLVAFGAGLTWGATLIKWHSR
ncbi:MAG TPA: beta-ketoacyl-ACP synthase III [Opitutales bacterium]|nr:beta-ketoacyl-ACP synthase III [Opitutales bacterium]